MEGLLTEPEVREILMPHFNEMYQTIFQSAIDELNLVMQFHPMQYTKRLKADFLNNIAINKAREYFSQIEGVTLHEKYESLHIVINKNLVLRMKKVDAKNQSKNIKTKRNDNLFKNQIPVFGEYGRQTFIDAGYFIDLSFTKIQRVSFSCRNPRGDWYFTISQVSNESHVSNTQEVVLKVRGESQLSIKKTGEV